MSYPLLRDKTLGIEIQMTSPAMSSHVILCAVNWRYRLLAQLALPIPLLTTIVIIVTYHVLRFCAREVLVPCVLLVQSVQVARVTGVRLRTHVVQAALMISRGMRAKWEGSVIDSD